MNLLLLLDMAASGHGDRVAVQSGADRLTYEQLLGAAWAGAAMLPAGTTGVAYVGTNGLDFPVALFAAAAAEVPFIPLNYRLGAEQLGELLARYPGAHVVEEGFAAAAVADPGSGDVPGDGEATAILLHTSGTTAAPKAAVLRHRHLTSYILGSVEFGGAGADEAALVSVPPYHVAGIANLLSNVFLGRRLV